MKPKKFVEDPLRPGKPLPNYKQQQVALRIIHAGEWKSGSQRGLGTGKGRSKGTADHISQRVREVIAAADKAIKCGDTLQEVTRRLAAVGLLEPDVFIRVMKRAPRYAPMQGIPARDTELIREITYPTDVEVAEFANMSVDVLKRMPPDFYNHMRRQCTEARMSPGELAVYKAMQYRAVAESYKEMVGEQQLARLNKRVAKRRRSAS